MKITGSFHLVKTERWPFYLENIGEKSFFDNLLKVKYQPTTRRVL